MALAAVISTGANATVVGPSATLPTSNLTCTATTVQFGTLTCTQFGVVGNDAALATTADGVTGLKFWLSSGLLDNENPGSPTSVLTFTSSGPVTGSGEPAGIVIPFAFDFSLFANSTGMLSSYSLMFNIQQGSTSIFSTAPTFSGSLSGNSQTITGGGPFTTVNPIVSGQNYTVTAQLTVNWNTGISPSGLTISVPQNSFDINSVGGSVAGTVPEPATFGLLSIGLLGGAIRRRRRKN